MNYLQKELYLLVREEDHIFSFIQEAALDGLWYWDLESPEDEWMDAKFWTTLGYTPSEMPHKVASWQNLIHPEDLEEAKKRIGAHLEIRKSPTTRSSDMLVSPGRQYGFVVGVKLFVTRTVSRFACSALIRT